MADQSKNAPAPADDGLDVIPVNKTPVGLIIGVLVAVLLVGGTLYWSMKGTKSKPAHAGTAPAASEQGLSKAELEKQREHVAMTQRALAKAEQAAEAKKAEEEAKKAEEEENKQAEAAKAKPGAGGPAPVSGVAAKKASGDLDNVLDSTLSGLE